jgi:hypothetical protein
MDADALPPSCAIPGLPRRFLRFNFFRALIEDTVGAVTLPLVNIDVGYVDWAQGLCRHSTLLAMACADELRAASDQSSRCRK